MLYQSVVRRSLNMALVLFCSCVVFAESNGEVQKTGLSITALRCEYRENPLGIETAMPRLSWVMESQGRGQRQSAYRILVATSLKDLQADNGNLWDSGKIYSDRSVQIAYQGKPLQSGQRCHWKIRVWDKDGLPSKWSEPARWEMALLTQKDWRGQWISDGRENPDKDEDFYKDDPAPLFRKVFTLDKKVRCARLYISGLGYYSASLNGRPVGDHQLDPAWTMYAKRVFYSTYDVTDQLGEGGNCLGVTLGNGWYNPLPLRMWGRRNLREHLTVGRPRFIAQLNINFEDGSSTAVVTDSSWKVKEGPIMHNSIYLGEKYDARREIPRWDQHGLDDSTWARVAVTQAPAGTLQAQPLPPIRVIATLKPIRISEPNEGVFIFDMGQNFTGWVRLALNVPRDTTITLRYGELLHKDGTLNPMTSVCGQIKGKRKTKDGQTINVGGPGAPEIAWQTDIYIAKGGGPESYTPRFMFHAFRYVEMTGFPGRPTLDMVQGLRLNTDVEQVGSFSCSHELLNQIQQMCKQTFLSNIMSVQSDCPHRERFGYGGDLVTTCEAFMLNFDMANFYSKAVWDWHDSARDDGMLTDTAPFVGIQYCGVGWAMAHPLTQLQLYRYYGDQRIVEQQYATSKRWFDLVTSKAEDHIIKAGLSDHEALETAPAPQMVTPLYCESARMLSRLARILGKEKEADEYARLGENIRRAYVEKFVAPGTGVVASGIQSAQAFALFLNMLPVEERPAALAHLVKDITDKHDGHLTTGIFGTRYMLDVLSREGRAEVVNNMVNLRDFPGWGYMLERGATTLWEHWEFSDNTFSHNHPMFGSVSQWFYNWLGGIEPAVDAVGFDKFTFQPQFLEGLDWVRCTYRSIRGPITCDWKREGNRVAMELQVPVNTSATLVLPTAGVITENGRPVADSKGVEKVSERDGHPIFQLGSGRYHFIFAPSEPVRNPL